MAEEQKKKAEVKEGFVLSGGYPMPKPLSYLNAKPSKHKPDSKQS